MRNLYRFLFVAVILAFSTSIYSQSLNLRFSNYFYTWQRLDSVPSPGEDATYTTHLKGYQNLIFDVNVGKWTVSSFVQTDEDLTNQIGRGFSYRFYNALVKGSNLFDALDVKLGRQYVSGGSGRGTIDGLYFKLKLGKNKEYQLIGYGGYLTPLNYEFEKYQKLTENFLAGGQFLYYGVKDLTLGLSYANKNRKYPDYYAQRPDSLFNTRSVLIETDSQADQIAGLDASYTLMKKHTMYAKSYFDITRNKFIRGVFNGNFALHDKVRLSVGYLYREPQISYNSIFWVFSHKEYQEFEGGLDVLTQFLNTDINLYGRFAGVIYDDDNSLKFQLGFSSPSYGISIVKYTGYTGEAEGITGYFYREMIKSKLSLSANLNYSRYQLSKYGEKTDAFGGSLGFTYRPDPHFSIDAQGQMLINDIYKFDTRFMIGFSYWRFTQL